MRLILLGLLLIGTLQLFADGVKNNNHKISERSGDNKFLITYFSESNTLEITDVLQKTLITSIPVINKSGDKSEVVGIRDAQKRNSFVVALKNSSEVWEINYQNPSPAGFGTWVHDYRTSSGEAVIKLFPIRRIMLDSPLDNFFLDMNHVNIISVSCKGRVQIVDLDLGKNVSDFNFHKKTNDRFKVYKIMSLSDSFFKILRDKAIHFNVTNCN